MKFRQHSEFKKGQLDIAPLIDVVFLLLIFFMLTSSYIFQPGIKIDLPKAVTSQAIQQRNLIVIIDERNRLFFENRRVSLEELKRDLSRKKDQGRPLLIKADQKASLGTVVRIWDLCRELGLTQINIATTQSLQ